MGLQIDADVANCSECGALSYDGLTCLERLHRILILERTDPELQSLHFLTMAAYNIQHPAQFTEEAVDRLRRSFSDYLDKKVTLLEIQEATSREFEGARRVLKPPRERLLILRGWDMTTADVFLTGDSGATAARIRKWAASIRAELQPPKP